MSWLAHEWRLLARSRICGFALLLLLAITSASVACGLHEIRRQQESIERLGALNDTELARLANRHARGESAGYAAYYSFHHTWDAPSVSAFAALGLRDVAPYALRVRALGLQAQLHEGETFNPEMALPGKFDFAFVLIYIAPLILIALLHDLVSSERQSGRLRMLLAMSGARGSPWLRRVGLRFALVLACMALPLLAGALWSGVSAGVLAAMLSIVAGYLAFWTGLAFFVATVGMRSTTNATLLMGLWALLTLALPALANVGVTRMAPVQQGVDLMLAQRQDIHAAWDRPRDATMAAFFQTHPEWKDTSPLPWGFHWKWYYAFQQLGDERVADQAKAYRDGLLRRQRWTRRLGDFLPGVGAQAALHRLADTDLEAQLAFQDRITAFHGEVRRFYYPYVFDEVAFTREDFLKAPRFRLTERAADAAPDATWSIWLLALVLFVASIRAARRIG
ncbi:ABC transporter permease [Variovorax saccharolyticus]|uniref:ABC transporter permease n=1 Tax=Variovorax saccharolyticus TaxID=3053516 RepID=UPI002578FFB2|nr:DUF3526 domain-containing protein [Variovorax sp. J22R187]MDM0018851.1 DUF3526 domain-containing protein [Variovorax sp. J22R187]